MKSYNPYYVKFAYPASNLNEKIQHKGELEQSQAFLFGVNKKVLSKNYIEYKRKNRNYEAKLFFNSQKQKA